MLPHRAPEDDHRGRPEDVTPPRLAATLGLRVLRRLVARSPAVITLAEDAPPAAEIREVVVARGVEVRSPLRLLRWHRRSSEAPSLDRPRRA